MVASENDSIKGMKVGGIGDVIRDIPKAVSALNHDVDIVLPAYDHVDVYGESQVLAEFSVPFSGKNEQVKLVELQLSNDSKQVRQLLLVHPLFFSAGVGQVYCHTDVQPFATDATKFAFFSIAVTEMLVQQKVALPDVIHLHDWHCACMVVLAKFDPQYHLLQGIRKVFTIHNIALQGIRPFTEQISSLESWYPQLNYQRELICDPRYLHCFNAMRAGITLADKVHVVSPNYTKEVQLASNAEQGFFGGEGLEQYLIQKAEKGRLIGILNGCDYDVAVRKKLSFDSFCQQAEQSLVKLTAQHNILLTSHYIAAHTITRWRKTAQETSKHSGPIVTSVGRLTDQKMLILRQTIGGKSVLSHLLTTLAEQRGYLFILGSGDSVIEAELVALMAEHDNLLFINGYIDSLSTTTYLSGDLFLMPSSFEPCGISQMLAMRAGQPCLVHHVGGLKDTIVIDGNNPNGFAFNGDSLEQQAVNLIECFTQTLHIFQHQANYWQHIVNNAKNTRFSWRDSVRQYVDKLYQ